MAKKSKLERAAGIGTDSERSSEYTIEGIRFTEHYGIAHARLGLIEIVVDWDSAAKGYKVSLRGAIILTAKARPTEHAEALKMSILFAKAQLRKMLAELEAAETQEGK